MITNDIVYIRIIEPNPDVTVPQNYSLKIEQKKSSVHGD